MKKKSGSMQERLRDFGDVILHPGLLILVSALVYLPFIGRFSYYFDDWYLMFAGISAGAEGFWQIYSIDRPGGALLIVPLFGLFGHDPLLYNLSAYGFRVLGALGLLYLGRSAWPNLRKEAFVVALLFLIYPGFLSQPNGIVYQYYLAGLAAAIWSVGFTVRAVISKNLWMKSWFFTLSILLGWFYLLQIEWYIGFEAIRWAVILAIRLREAGTLRHTIAHTLIQGLPVLLIPITFLVWRLLIFEGERGATDVGLQLGSLFSYPLQTGFRWSISLLQDIFNVLVTAWVIPFTRYAFPMNALDTGIALGIGALAIYFSWFGLKRVQPKGVTQRDETLTWWREMFWIGIVAIVFGLLPVTLANREISFPTYSRYTLVASLGVALVIAVCLFRWFSPKSQTIGCSLLILISASTHYGNALEYARWTTVYNKYWWQVSWRVPQFEKNTTLVANIPTVATEEDYFIWGPANLIYYPESQNTKVIQPSLFAAVLNPLTVQNVLTRQRQEYDNRRGIITYKNYRNMLILTQPTLDSCVHVIDGMQPEFSPHELDAVRVIGAYSEIEHVLVNETPHAPPELIFGPEPPRTWCYFYQAADLARQRGDWESVIRLGNEAHVNGFAPSDLIEWMPFLQAYAVTGDVDRLIELAPIISGEPYAALQVCRNIGGLADISEGVVEVIDARYCLE